MLGENTPEAHCLSWMEDASIVNPIALCDDLFKDSVHIMERSLPVLQPFQLFLTSSRLLKSLWLRKHRPLDDFGEGIL